jgi:3-oxoacyl-[acyl-carrier-protein] synthase II
MVRVVVTGIGAVTSIGCDIDTIEHNLYNGISGIKWVDEYSTVHGVVDYDLNKHFTSTEDHTTDRFTKMAWVAYEKAKHDSYNLTPESIFFGVAFGGGAVTVEECYNSFSANKRISPLSLIKAIPCMGAGFIALKEGIKGPSITYTTACSASSVALGEAYHKILLGEVNSAVVVGAESLNTRLNSSTWRALGAVNEVKDTAYQAVRPFSKDRKGTAVGEGAVALILETEESARKRNAKIYAEIVAYSTRTGTETLAKPSKAAQVDVMLSALKNIDKEQVTYINAHGTGTPTGDVIELESIKEVFGDLVEQIPISSTKSLTGHLLGAAGAMESLACLLVLKNNKVIPNHFLEPRDDLIDTKMWLPTTTVEKEMDIVLNNSFAFGGSNVCLGFKKWK